MHQYTALHHDRKNTYYLLAAISGLVGSLASAAISMLTSKWGIVIAGPSGLAIFGLVFLIFDQFLWHMPVFYKLGLAKFPNLNGEWAGYIKSSAPIGEPIPVSVTIHQTYSKIRVRLETEKSTSLSRMATFQMEDPTYFVFRWEYLSEFRPEPGADPKRHYGVTKLTLKIDGDGFLPIQHGSYYTELDRDTHGEITIQRNHKQEVKRDAEPTSSTSG